MFGHSKNAPRSALRTIWIPAPVLDHTTTVLRRSAADGQAHEGIAYWAGRHVGSESFVLSCIAPPARTTVGSFTTSGPTNARVVMHLAQSGLELLGQVHSHPGRFVDHSEGDDEGALMPYDSFLSIVVPHYAHRGMRPLETCGIHVFERGRFRRLSTHEIERSFRTVDSFADIHQ